MITEPTRLPYTRPPESDESLRGYLLGLAIDNGYPSLASLMEISGSPKSRPTTFDTYDLAPLAQLVAQPQVDLQNLTYPPTAKSSRIFLRQTIPAFLISPRRMKFCPTCIKEAPDLKTSFKAIWDLQLSVTCQKHGTYLVSECESCKTAPSWFATPWYQCTCGHDLRKTSPIKADSGVLDLSHHLTWRLTSGQKPLPGQLPKEFILIDPGNLLWIVAIIGCWANGFVEGQTSRRLELLSSDQRIEILKKAYNVFTNWPSNFRSFLDQCRGLARQPNSSSFMNQEFGALFESLMYKIRDPHSEFIRAELRLYGETLSFEEEVHDFNDASLNGLSKEIRVGVSAIRKMVERGTVKIFKEKRGYNKDRYFISDTDIKSLRRHLKGNISLQEVSKILGLGIKMTARLRDENLFTADTHNLSDGRYDAMYSREEIENILNPLASEALQVKETPADRFQKITEAMRLYCIKGLKRSNLLKSALDGSLPIYKIVNSPKLDEIFIEKKDAKEYVLNIINRDKDLISPGKASDEFGISQKQIARLTSNRTISSTIVTHGRKFKLVSRKSIQAWVTKLGQTP